MIHIRDEGELIRQGVNIYPRTSKTSRGFIIRIWDWVFRCRYSIPQGKWVLSKGKVSK